MIQSSSASCHMRVKDFKPILFLLRSFSVRKVPSLLFALTVNSVALMFDCFSHLHSASFESLLSFQEASS